MFRSLKRLTLMSIGLVFLGLGIVGYVVPGLPGTIWLIYIVSRPIVRRPRKEP